MELTELLTKRAARKACADLSLSQTAKLIKVLNEVLEEKKLKDQESEEVKKKKRDVLRNIADLMAQAGISKSELKTYADEELSGKRPRRTMKARYRFTGTDGLTHEWTGQGKLPVELRKLIERDGTTKQDYLIKDEDQQA
ncbi:MAG: H-NS family nucleoid-associated regulatory protein [Succinivibrio sp.]|jgi:DNA-binding protein H-NS|nr:H-NS family nucleoid-associated regulatory protein [Succinivibrio sp.]